MSTRSRRTFQQLVTLPEGAIPLAEAALLLACEEYPQLESLPTSINWMRSRISSVEDASRASPLWTPSTRSTMCCLVRMGFRGNTENYNDPRNSFFNDVLERRVGIPITLSTVYLEVARRLPFPIVGVGLPGHFLVKYSDRAQEVFLDPFNRGEILTRDDCSQRLAQIFGDSQTVFRTHAGRRHTPPDSVADAEQSESDLPEDSHLRQRPGHGGHDADHRTRGL